MPASLLSQVPHNNEPSLDRAAVLNKAQEQFCIHALGAMGPNKVVLNKYLKNPNKKELALILLYSLSHPTNKSGCCTFFGVFMRQCEFMGVRGSTRLKKRDKNLYC